MLVLSIKLFPLVFLYVSGALKNLDSSLLEASTNMGCTGMKRFVKVVLPLCMPSILAAALMVFMNALADFGSVMVLGEGIQALSTMVYKEYINEIGGNTNAPCVMIGERAADFILGKPALPAAELPPESVARYKPKARKAA